VDSQADSPASVTFPDWCTPGHCPRPAVPARLPCLHVSNPTRPPAAATSVQDGGDELTYMRVHLVLLLICMVVMIMLVLRILCFPIFPPPLPLFVFAFSLPSRLAATVDAIPSMVGVVRFAAVVVIAFVFFFITKYQETNHGAESLCL
jgi:hypothetical protein